MSQLAAMSANALLDRGSQEMLEQAPQKVQEFEQVLDGLRDQQQEDVVKIAAREQTEKAGAVEGLYAERLQQAEHADGVRQILDEVQAGHVRMRGLIDDLQSGKTFSAQELLAVQSEVFDLSVNLQVSTRVISEVVSNVKQLLTQQI